ncbi:MULTISPECIES: ThuA domain-containing protein [Arthrobacter]|uniref:ThuA domain-containing protein n=1 Tax=Arthrobacter terricola TaxID=2547396 RepID=A0A4R5K5Q8_9MICC|nr:MULTISPECIES: ThuA domain-containing protein [Arthrobacter]MBT8163586.1 ThuA domain-containing protein [Arthrobacter sp. GN70]TDF88581.1 ThuA domain-containing protein [Arthrobacter terricola]
MTKALYLYGGWPGHNPYGVAVWTRNVLEELGFQVVESTDIFVLDQDLTDYDLIINNWNNALLSETLTPSQEERLLGAVQTGTGFVSWHGGGAAFRGSVMYHMMLGADVFYHPAGEGVRHPYPLYVVDPDHPITVGIDHFQAASEQYYMNVDPRNHVLLETVFDGEHMPWLDGQRMPQAWTKQWGDGRVFYSALGHYLEDLTAAPVEELMRRAFLWARRDS